MKTLPNLLFSWRKTILYAAIFAVGFFVMQRLWRLICERIVAFDCPYYFPVSIGSPRLPSVQDCVVAVIVALVFFGVMMVLEMTRWLDVTTLILGAAILIAGSNLVQGFEVGFYSPISGDARSGTLIPTSLEGQEYFHESLKIQNPIDFLIRYNEIQPDLTMHSHTHPPGAVLTFYFFDKVFGDSALIALAIMLIATVLTTIFVYKLMRTEFDEEISGFAAFLFMLIPAIQIYYLATLDAIITGLLTATLYLFCFGKGYKAIVGAIFTLTLSFLLTFVSLFILPVLVGFELLMKRSLKRSFIVIGAMVAFHVLLYAISGYNAWESFRTASFYENPKGFMLFVNPINYFFTRIEDVAEIIFFFTPFLTVLFVRGMRISRLEPLNVLTILGCLVLLGMYLCGAWRTGETARACAYIYPFLMFPIARYLQKIEANAGQKLQLAALVFGQTLFMQTFGNYFW